VQILALIESPGHVSARHRIADFGPALDRAGISVRFEPIPRDALGRIRLFTKARRFDAVILQRRLLPAYQLSFLRGMSRRLIYDVDDAMFHRDSYHRKGIAARDRARQFRRIVRAADTVIAGNEFLRDRAIADGAVPARVHVIPTCVDPLKYPTREHRRAPSLDLVWIGSSSTLQGIERKRAMFEKLGERFPYLRIRVICDRFPQFSRLAILPRRWSAQSEAAEVASGDIGIAWVPDDEWSKGKCGYKILQYFAAGLPVIANPAAIHPLLVRNGETGYLADSDEQWASAVDALSEPAARARMGMAARDFVERNYSISVYAGRFAEILRDAPPAAAPAGRASASKR
jgi:glycosyltransferase involved in cell wall biosynthesis